MGLTQVQRYYPTLTVGWHPNLPPRLLDPQNNPPFIFKGAQNVIERDGFLARRPAIAATTSGFTPPYQLLTGAADDTEVPLIILPIEYVRPTVGLTATIVILVTNRCIWLNVNYPLLSAWLNVTPTYSTGTVTATNGTANVTGAGTSWLTDHNIQSGVITIAGVAYKISAVSSDTALTLTTNYAGATGGGKAYSILRTFSGFLPLVGTDDFGAEMFAAVSNTTLYVAGTGCGGIFTQTAVLKISGINTATPTSTYITSNVTLIPGLDVVTNMSRITGLKVLQDGRVVVTGEQNTVFYSSLLNDAVWTVSPGGQTPVDLIQSRINCCGQIGTTYTLHHPGGVVLANPTGLTDPPLSFRASDASSGVYAPRTLKTINGYEVGVDVNGEVIRFDKSRTTVVSEALRDQLSLNPLRMRNLHAAVDEKREEYTLFLPSVTGTTFWTFQPQQNGRWWPHVAGIPITCMSDLPSLTSGAGTARRALLGAYAIDGGAENTSIIYAYNADAADASSYSGATAPRFYFDTDDLDFGNPNSYKCAHRVVLWGVRTASGTVPIIASVSRDSGTNWTNLLAVNWPSTIGEETNLQFSFDELSPGAGQALRFRIEINTATIPLKLTRLLIVALESGFIEQVEL